ncbi:MAG: 3-hydroxybutyryl-CoA dehydrogenase, partial [Solirubrobacteraceae bacterium]|nr:3-hydroxybutyryl-CoA dehydrogenase [Solirubrobacteraceae bacterium]
RGVERIERAWQRRPVPGARDHLQPASALEELGECDLIIEAAPERLELKGELLRELADRTDAVLATNTSSIPVTAIGAASGSPERVVGMHFFNPAPVMRLVEVVAGLETSPEAVAAAHAAAEAMGRRVIEAADGIGFLVNRCNRPFALEALRIVHEGIATPEQVDRICRLGGGFRMGPFELMDLVGIDVGLEIACSFFEQSFHEPRWRPSPLQRRMVDAGRLGRKSGRGWYEYPAGRPEDPPAPEPGGGDGLIVIAGELPVALELAALAEMAGWAVVTPEEAGGEVPFLAIDAGGGEEQPLQGAPRLLLCAEASLAAQELGGPALGFSAVPPLVTGGLVELTRSAGTPEAAAQAAERFAASLGLHVAWVGDSPGLVLARIVAALVNEAAFAIAEGVAVPEDVDEGMVLGLNHPRGPLAWADAMGIEHVVRVMDGLAEGTGTDRYGLAPLLGRMLHEDATFHSV